MQEQISATFPCEIMFLKPFSPYKIKHRHKPSYDFWLHTVQKDAH